MTNQVDHTPSRTGAVTGFHDVTIIAGTARRRRFSMDEKLRIVAESFDPAVSVSAVARRYGINPNQLFYWRKRLHAEVRGESSGSDAACSAAGGAAPDACDLIELALDGVTIRVRSGVNGAALRRVLAALRGVR